MWGLSTFLLELYLQCFAYVWIYFQCWSSFLNYFSLAHISFCYETTITCDFLFIPYVYYVFNQWLIITKSVMYLFQWCHSMLRMSIDDFRRFPLVQYYKFSHPPWHPPSRVGWQLANGLQLQEVLANIIWSTTPIWAKHYWNPKIMNLVWVSWRTNW